MGFLAIVNAYTMRICLNVAITEMVKKIPPPSDNSTKGQFCPIEGGESGGSLGGGDFEWSETLQGVILGAFFWGYVRFLDDFKTFILWLLFLGDYACSRRHFKVSIVF